MDATHKGRKLGFILSTIHAGSALKLWHKVVAREMQDSAKNGGAFFVFAGGKLDSESAESTEPLRNEIYKLVNSSNLDALISWASSVSGSVPVQEVEDFHNQFSDLPFVTIGQKVSGHPCVEFDAYTGMKELVQHLIKVHGFEKIAFLRGPATHTSAEERFRGYKDALKEAEVPESEWGYLITSPFSWYEGDRAALQLINEKGLVPGKDFNAVVAASDLMAFAAVDCFKKRNIRIPKDLAVVGFNDTEESKISIPSFSTVHMPHAELGIAAYEKISSILSGDLSPAANEDSNLPAYPVIRESCGCTHSKTSKVKVHSKEQFVEEVAKIFRVGNDDSRLVPMFNALFDYERAKFYDLFTQNVTKYFKNDGETLKLFQAFEIFRGVLFLSPDYIEKILNYVTVSVSRIQERVSIEKQYQIDKINAAVSSLKNDLLSVFDRAELISVLKDSLGKIGIDSLAIVLYEDEVYSNYIGGFVPSDSDNLSAVLRVEKVKFPRINLVPERFSSDFSRGTFIVQPLFVEGRSLGYIICNYSSLGTVVKGIAYEDLRSSVSAALQSIFMFEQTNEAKRIAEQAEFAKTEFFANVGSDLCDPLKNISAKLQQMESNIENGMLEKDIITEQLIFLRSQVESQLEKTQVLVDLTRSQVDDLPMDKKLFDIRQALPGSIAVLINEEFPLLYGDSDRLKRALQTIFDFSEKTPYIFAKPDGIHIEIYSNHFDWQKPELLLAEKIILLQYGSLEKTVNYSEITFPWPNFAEVPASDAKNSGFVYFSLSPVSQEMSEKYKHIFAEDKELKYIFDTSELSDSSRSAELPVLFWEPDSAPIDEWVKVYGLRSNETFFRSPLICYSRSLIGQTFSSVLEQKVKKQRTASVLFIGAKQMQYGTWATPANSVGISSMSEFEKIISEITPTLIVFDKIDEPAIREIRRNQKTILVPVLIIPELIVDEAEVDSICAYPRVLLCNRGAAKSEDFENRIKKILSGAEILAPHTGALVKKAILYLNKNSTQQIVRWRLADFVHVSEDYLTRIFHREIGLSLWEYLNRYRVEMATKMLIETNDTIYEIAENCGFQDQAYFCRVFKKIYGVSPGKTRNK